MSEGFRVEGLEFRVWGGWFRVQSLVWGLRISMYGCECRRFKSSQVSAPDAQKPSAATPWHLVLLVGFGVLGL